MLPYDWWLAGLVRPGEGEGASSVDPGSFPGLLRKLGRDVLAEGVLHFGWARSRGRYKGK